MTKKIYILHGWTYSLDKWEDFSDLLKKEGFDPVFLKIPGLTVKSDQVWDVKKYSDWLYNELLKTKEKVILLGHSNGGRIAAFFAAEHPEKIQDLILIDSAGIYHKELSLQIKRFVFGNVTKIGKKFTSSEALKNFLYHLAGEHDYQKASVNMKLSMVNLTRHDLTPFLSKITVPTLIIWGQNDKITPVSDAQIIRKLIKNSKLEIVKDARHTPFFTNPKEVVRIIKNGI
jgi:pimeloyl-ACP methyl ester carboxylesterase